MSVVERILVIKHGALGDWVLATGCFAAIRRHHWSARITLLTTPAFAELGGCCGWFDEVWTDKRPSILADPLAWITLRRRLIHSEFARVYDLQTSSRTGHYFRMLPRRYRPEWSGTASGCSHPHRNPQRPFMHTLERLAEQLGIAGIENVPAPNLDWLHDDIDGMVPPGGCALIVPGGSAHRPEKRWPLERFAHLALLLSARGAMPVLIGAEAEALVLDEITRLVPGTINLGGRTSLGQIAVLARRATCAVGNDTGPIHIAAAVGCPSVALFGAGSDPIQYRPRGESVEILRRMPLADLPVADVIDAARRVASRA